MKADVKSSGSAASTAQPHHDGGLGFSLSQDEPLEPGCLSDERLMVLGDAAMEIKGLISSTIKAHFPLNNMNDSDMFAIRGVLLRLDALANVMYQAACICDAELNDTLKQVYGEHHDFTPAKVLQQDGRTA